MSPETLILLRNILLAQQLQVGSEGFLSTAQAAARALAEIDEALAKEVTVQ